MLYTIIIIILFFIFSGFIYYNNRWIIADKNVYNNDFIIISHRGNHQKYYENTIPAFYSALEYNIDGIELDIQMTFDKRLIVFHDFHLKKLGQPNILIQKTKWEEINNYQLGKNKLETIPLLEQVLSSIGGKTILNIEIKSYNLLDLSISENVIKIIKKNNLLNQCIISSFNPLILKKIKKKYPEVLIAWIWSKNNSYRVLRTIHWLNFVKPDFFHGDINSLNKNIINKIKKHNLKIIAYTVNSKEQYNKSKEIGLDGIITDYLDKYVIKK